MIAQLWDISMRLLRTIAQINSLMEEMKDIFMLVVPHLLSLINENICKTLVHLNCAMRKAEISSWNQVQFS